MFLVFLYCLYGETHLCIVAHIQYAWSCNEEVENPFCKKIQMNILPYCEVNLHDNFWYKRLPKFRHTHTGPADEKMGNCERHRNAGSSLTTPLSCRCCLWTEHVHIRRYVVAVLPFKHHKIQYTAKIQEILQISTSSHLFSQAMMDSTVVICINSTSHRSHGLR